MQLKFDKPEVIEWIGYNHVCLNARFVFDKPIKIEPDDILELVNGCWSLIAKGVYIPMQGRWDR